MDGISDVRADLDAGAPVLGGARPYALLVRALEESEYLAIAKHPE